MREKKYHKIIIAKKSVIDRYVDFMANSSNKSGDYIVESYKKSFNIEFVGLETEVNPFECTKYLS